MRCNKCGFDNGKAAKACGKCGAPLAPADKAAKAKAAPEEPAAPFWTPTWRWHLKALAAIFLFLIVLFFALDRFLSRLPEPYHPRDIPKDMTPWLNK